MGYGHDVIMSLFEPGRTWRNMIMYIIKDIFIANHQSLQGY